MKGDESALFNSRKEVERALKELEYAMHDLRCSLDHSPLDHFWSAWQRQGQARILMVAASMDVGYFGLPHPWDLRPRTPETLADQYMKTALGKLSR